MYKNILLQLLLLFVALNTVQAQSSSSIQHFYVGSYTDNGSEGIYRFGLDRNSGKLHSNGLAALSENPSFLAVTTDKKQLLSVRETKDENNQSSGYIELFNIDFDGNLTSVNKVSSGGAHPCHVTVNESGAIIASNYTGGSVSLLRIGENGELTEVLNLIQHVGKGVVVGRQDAPHVHSAIFEPNGYRLFVADLGLDCIKVYVLDKATFVLKPAKHPEIKLAAGSGPRHMVMHPNRSTLFIANELNSTISVVQLLENGGFKILPAISSLPVGYSKPNTCADIHLSPDGKFLYVSNRGMNSITIFSFQEKTAELKMIGFENTRGETPRNFTLTSEGDYLLVANQNSDNIVAFLRNQNTGLLSFVDQIYANKPVCLLFN